MLFASVDHVPRPAFIAPVRVLRSLLSALLLLLRLLGQSLSSVGGRGTVLLRRHCLRRVLAPRVVGRIDDAHLLWNVLLGCLNELLSLRPVLPGLRVDDGLAGVALVLVGVVNLSRKYVGTPSGPVMDLVTAEGREMGGLNLH